MRFARRLDKYLAQPRDGTVPCGNCVACCYHPNVDVCAEDDVQFLDVTEHGALRKRPDGACIHLGTDGCTVYEHRPKACRQYDCRMPAAVGIERVYDGGMKAPVWKFDIKTEAERRFVRAAQKLQSERIWTSLEDLVLMAAREACGG